LLVGGCGFAVTALLTLAGAMKETTLISYVALPCLVYMIGVVCGVFAAFYYAASQRKFANYWFFRARGDNKNRDTNKRDADKLRDKARWSIYFGLISFVFGSVLAGVAIFLSHSVKAPFAAL
jgi:hypothetical protein